MKMPMMIKPRMAVYLALLVATIVLMVMLGRCSRRYAAAEERKSGGDTIDVAIEYAPLSLYTYADTLGGFNHDLLIMMARRHNLHIKMRPMTSLDESLRQLREGVVDVVAAQVPSTAEFKQQYLFTDAIVIDNQVLVQRCGKDGTATIKTQLDLAGKTVCVAKGSPVVSRIESLSREIGDSIFVSQFDYSQEQLFLLVASGEQMFAVVSDKTARSLAAQYPDIDINTAVSFNQFQSWAIAKNNAALLKKLNQWIKEDQQTEEYKSLKKRYNL